MKISILLALLVILLGCQTEVETLKGNWSIESQYIDQNIMFDEMHQNTSRLNENSERSEMRNFGSFSRIDGVMMFLFSTENMNDFILEIKNEGICITNKKQKIETRNLWRVSYASKLKRIYTNKDKTDYLKYEIDANQLILSKGTVVNTFKRVD